MIEKSANDTLNDTVNGAANIAGASAPVVF